jgi:hypothetical protein
MMYVAEKHTKDISVFTLMESKTKVSKNNWLKKVSAASNTSSYIPQ